MVQGAVSSDGLRWTVLDTPLVNVGNSVLDTQNVAAYEPETGEYVAYLRGMFHNENKKSDLAALKGKQVAVRLYLARAKVFSMAI